MRPTKWIALAGLALGAAGQVSAAAPTDADRQAARALLEKIAAIRTAKGQGQVPVLIDVLAARLKAAGFTDADIARTPVKVGDETTSGLLVRFAGRDAARKPVLFLAHMDVVDAVAANWTSDPYKPVERDGYLYGRGVQDNKTGVTMLVETVARLKKEGWQPDRTLVLALAGDEETGMLTTRANIAHPWVKGADYALNSDAGGASMDATGGATSFEMQAAEKTNATFELTVTNAGGHSSVPRPDNAIYRLAAAIAKVEALRFPVQFNEITRAMVQREARTAAPEVAGALTALLKDPKDAAADAVMRRVPDPGNLLWTTCVATMLRAGNAPNALPQNAVATVNCRILPGTPVEQVRARIAEAVADPEVKVTLDGEAVESPASPVRADVVALLSRGIAVNYPGMTLEPAMSSGGTEGREYRRAGIPTYGAGSLALVRPADSLAHGIDERVPLSSFGKELGFWDRLMRDVGASK
jgi:acetylornithine deacetylase/succinyl-diaminopimelate desuccinylase-like protein